VISARTADGRAELSGGLRHALDVGFNHGGVEVALDLSLRIAQFLDRFRALILTNSNRGSIAIEQKKTRTVARTGLSVSVVKLLIRIVAFKVRNLSYL